MAAKYADGVLINASHPDDVAWAVEQVEDGLRTRPDERGAFDVLVFASVSVASSRDAAEEAARPPVAFIASGADPRVLDRHGIDADQAAAIGRLIEVGSFADAFAAVTPAMIEAFCIAGTAEQVAKKMDAIAESVDGIVAGSPLGPDPAAAIELIAEASDGPSAGRTDRR
jgi:5,10-methylenetetrahydromethanopterin reductase